ARSRTATTACATSPSPARTASACASPPVSPDSWLLTPGSSGTIPFEHGGFKAMAQQWYDIVLVGGGIVGLATARDLLMRRPGQRIAILEKESTIGQHQTGHNSGVIHAGVYYAPG